MNIGRYTTALAAVTAARRIFAGGYVEEYSLAYRGESELFAIVENVGPVRYTRTGSFPMITARPCDHNRSVAIGWSRLFEASNA